MPKRREEDHKEEEDIVNWLDLQTNLICRKTAVLLRIHNWVIKVKEVTSS